MTDARAADITEPIRTERERDALRVALEALECDYCALLLAAPDDAHEAMIAYLGSNDGRGKRTIAAARLSIAAAYPVRDMGPSDLLNGLQSHVNAPGDRPTVMGRG